MAVRLKILFLCPYPFNEVASQRFRFEQYYRILTDQDYDISHKSFYSNQTYKILYEEKKYLNKFFGTIWGFARRLFHLFSALSADYVFVHREITPLGPPVFEWILARLFRKRIIYDFDDAIWLSNTSEENQLISGLKWHKKFYSICRWSYKISCCNEFLASTARKNNNNVTIIPTTIDMETSVPTEGRKKKNITIGWTGTHSTLPFLSEMLPVLEKVAQKYPEVIIRIICNKKPDWQLPGLDYVSWEKSTEIEDLSGMDIGLMPLPDYEWTRGKCGFKILQYFSLGIPAIASPVGLNNDIVRDGINGYLCRDETEWIDKLEELIQDGELRRRMGQAGRNTVIEHYSLTANATTFLRLFE